MKFKILFLICGLIGSIHADDQKPDIQKVRDLMRLKKTSECKRCDLEGLDLRNAIATAQRNNPGKRIVIGYSDLRNCNLENTDLSNAVIARSNLSHANFSNANLEKTILNESIIDGTNFSRINGKNAFFDKVQISYKKAIFTGALLAGASFKASKLARNTQYCIFDDADLYKTDFFRSVLNPISFHNARNIYYAHFDETTLESLFNLKALWYTWKHKLFL